MANAQGMTKKELKQLHKLEKLQKQNLESKQNMVKWVVILVSSILFLTLFVGTILLAKQKKKQEAIQANTSREFSDVGWIRGNATAGATLTEFADFQCPACRAYHPLVKTLLETYPQDLKVQYKQFPIFSIHKNAIEAGVAAEAAGRQGKFFELGDILYEKQLEWENEPKPQEKFLEYAKSIKLDMDKFKKDIEDKALKDRIETMRAEGIKNGVNSTPTFFINGKKITENPKDLSEFQKIIDEALKSTTPVTQASPAVSNTPPVPSTQQPIDKTLPFQP